MHRSPFHTLLRDEVASSHTSQEVAAVIRWKTRYMRVAVAVAAFLSVAIASGAGARWK
jgi:hypothetical protein